MPTLLLRLCGPMQSWGTRSRFSERDTELEPSKSGVIGLLCAALGRPRDQPVDDLAALTMGVRVDQEGTMARDYHTAGGGRPGAFGTGIIRANGKLSEAAQLSNRYYLAGADFLVGLEGEDAGLLHCLDANLRAPHWQLSLGRKSFVPALPVYLPGEGVRQGAMEAVLQGEPWPLRPIAFHNPTKGAPRRLRYVLERAPGATSEVRMDQPLGAAFLTRRFGPRWVETCFFESKE